MISKPVKSLAGTITALLLMVPAGALAQSEDVATSGSANADDHSAKLTEARAIIGIMFPEQEREKSFGRLIGDVANQFAGALPPSALNDPGLKAIFNAYMDSIPAKLMPVVRVYLPRMLEATAIAYSRNFTLQELRDVHAFAQTPSGRNYLQKSISMTSDPAVAEANTAYFAELMKLQERATAELKAQVMAYLQDNPELADELTPD